MVVTQTSFMQPRQSMWVHSSPPDKMAANLADNILKCNFMNEMFCVLTKISLQFVPYDLIDNSPALVQIMGWRRIGDKPLSEPMLTRFTHAYSAALGGDKLNHKHLQLLVLTSTCQWLGAKSEAKKRKREREFKFIGLFFGQRTSESI